MKRNHIYILVSLLIATVIMIYAFSKPEKAKETDTTGYSIAEWTLSKRCSDGTEIYQLADGDYAIWRGQDENDQHWVKLSPGVDPSDYCN